MISKMSIVKVKTKLVRILHDAKATFCSKAGPSLKYVKEHPKIHNKILIQDNSYTFYQNKFEEAFYNCSAQIKFYHPETFLYFLTDVWITGSEGHLFFEPNQLFSICPSINGIKPRKIRRPIKSLAQIIKEPIFILSGRAPGNRGHFLIEHLPRLIASMDIIKRLGKYKILVTPEHRKWQVEYLRKLDIPESEVIEASIGSVFCKRAFYTPMLCQGEIATVSHKKYYDFLRKHFMGDRQVDHNGSTIFLSRKDALYRKLVNEDAIFSITKKYFPAMKRVALSKLSLNEQIKLFQKASVIIGPHSQSFRNLLFPSRSICVQLVQGFRDSLNEYYKWAQNYNFVGSVGENLCLPLFNEIKFHKNSDWLYPEDKFKKDLIRLIKVIHKKRIFFNQGNSKFL